MAVPATSGAAATPPPEGFALACAALRTWAGSDHTPVLLTEVEAPARVAPFGIALAAELGDDDPELEPPASGRFVVLHDPAGQPGWGGDTRVVIFARADLEPDLARDPLLSEVAWSWVSEALTAHGAGHHAGGGTVTVTASRRFGVLADGSAPAGEPAESCEVELRCSWTPSTTDGGALTAHLSAFCDLLATTAGRPPDTPGVVTLRPRG